MYIEANGYILYTIKSTKNRYELFNSCTAIFNADRSRCVLVIAPRWQSKLKAMFWGPLTNEELARDILENEQFKEWFEENSEWFDGTFENLYPVCKLRSIMWELGMKRPPRAKWEY